MKSSYVNVYVQLVEDGTHNLHFCRVEEFKDDPMNEEDRNIVLQLKQRALVFAE